MDRPDGRVCQNVDKYSILYYTLDILFLVRNLHVRLVRVLLRRLELDVDVVVENLPLQFQVALAFPVGQLHISAAFEI